MRKVVVDTIKLHKRLLDEFETGCIDKTIKAAEMIIECLNSNGRIYLCGNGGSAADAQHIAGELVGRFNRQRKAFPAVALTTDTSVITSIANDYCFDQVFARQIEGLINAKDILWTFSTSGTSKNIIAAAMMAKKIGAKVLAFTGKADTELERIADLTISVPSPTTASAQEIHQLAYHIICDLVEEKMA